MENIEFYKYLVDPKMLNEETLPQLESICNDFPYFELGWLLYLKNLKQVNSEQFEKVLPQAAIRISNRKQLHRYLYDSNIFHEELETENKAEDNTYRFGKDDKLKPGDSLIDKFLQSKPERIRPVYTGSNDNEAKKSKKVIEESEIENDDFITETLANIYFQQKNYDKAIESFEKLSLKYPEKSVYFASRIKEIEKKKN